MNTIPVFYCEEILADSDSRSPSASKPKPVVAGWHASGLPIDVRKPIPATVAELSLAHDGAFVESILTCKAVNGFGNTRVDVARSLQYTTGAMICAAREAVAGGIACAPVSGFHHAGYATATMFCTFNGLLVAALALLRAAEVKRVLVLDCDFHYGNGTDEIIERLNLASEIENAAFGRSYRESSKAKLYLQELERVAARFSEFDLVLYQAGADLHVDDPLGGVLDSAQMRQRDRMVFEAAKQSGTALAWDLAGGYQVPVSKVVKLHVATMEECVRAYVADGPI